MRRNIYFPVQETPGQLVSINRNPQVDNMHTRLVECFQKIWEREVHVMLVFGQQYGAPLGRICTMDYDDLEDYVLDWIDGLVCRSINQ